VMLYGGFAFGWLLVLVTTFAINHFDLFGLLQVWRHLLGQSQTKMRFAVGYSCLIGSCSGAIHPTIHPPICAEPSGF